MKKQIIAAIICVLVSFAIPLIAQVIVMVPMAVDTISTRRAVGEDFSASIYATAFLLSGAAGLVSFISVVYLKLQYVTIGLCIMASAAMVTFFFFNFGFVAALAGSVAFVGLVGGICFGLWRMLQWVYRKDLLSTAKTANEFT